MMSSSYHVVTCCPVGYLLHKAPGQTANTYLSKLVQLFLILFSDRDGKEFICQINSCTAYM